MNRLLYPLLLATSLLASFTAFAQSWQPCTPGYGPPSGSCPSIPQIMATNVYCGNTTGGTLNYNWIASSGQFCPGSAQTLENNSFYMFQAAQTTINFTVCCGTGCSRRNNGFGDSGLQFLLFNFNTANGQAASCASWASAQAITAYCCIKQLSNTDCSSCGGTSSGLNVPSGKKNCVATSVSGLTVGKYYYIMFDGFQGDNCPFQIQFDKNSVLPIDLLSLNGLSKNTGNEVTWATATETNNSHFELESSANGEDWTNINTQKGAGNSTATLNYSFLDVNPPALLSYYRLKQVDFNGAYTYSKIVAVQASAFAHALIAPNPVADVLQVELNAPADGLYTFTFTSMAGLSLDKKIELKKGSNRLAIDVTTDLRSGVYFLKITDEGGNTLGTNKLLKY
ncbi:MAG: T9SS type A sorting domain-containing protein [Bacteroidetes bacterium]|nr:T9SS type A sorting domain-containing protein [Bacteroidota bacterium]